MIDTQDLVVSTETSLRDTMSVVDRGRVEIALVVNTGNRLLGTITDGDIRRAILRGSSLDMPASQVMNRKFTAVTPETGSQEVLDLMQARKIKQIPVLDADGLLVGLHVWQDLIGVKERPNWAIIMAGGEGRRLWPLTNSVPKPMLTVGGRPLLERTITQLVGSGLTQIFLAIRYLGDQIEEYFGDGKRFGCHIVYLRERIPLGTAGALSLLPQKSGDPVLIINGDLVTEINFASLLDYHAHHHCPATLCVKEFRYQLPYGIVRIEDQLVSEVREKPIQSFLINAGIYVLDPDLIDLIPNGIPYDLPELITGLQNHGKSIGAFLIREQWIDIGRLEDYQQIEAYLSTGEDGV